MLEEELAALRSLRGQGGVVTLWGGGGVEEKLLHQASCASNGTGSAQHRRYTQFYLLYWCFAGTKVQILTSNGTGSAEHRRYTQFYLLYWCFAGTKVQILTSNGNWQRGASSGGA